MTAPTRQQIDRAAPLDFPATQPTERQANITIEVAPDGLHVRAEYTGSLATIPTVIERLRALGVVELVNASRPTPTATAAPTAAPAPAQRVKAELVQPIHRPSGEACCPVHQRELSEGQYGLFCSAKARPGEVADKKGYCGLKFSA